MRKLPCLLLPAILFLCSCENAKDKQEQALGYLKQGDNERALEAINEAISLEPDSAQNYAVRALALDRARRYKEELTDLDRLVGLLQANGSKAMNAHSQKAVVETRLGLNEAALKDIDYYLDNREANTRQDRQELMGGRLTKASILYRLGRREQAKRLYQSIVEEEGEIDSSIKSSALVGLANVTSSASQALKMLKKSIELDGNNALAYGARAEIYLRQGKIHEAYNDTKKALTINPEEPSINYNMGLLQINHLKQNDSAVLYFEKAVSLAPESSTSWSSYEALASAYQRLGKLAEAASAYQEAEKLNPGDPEQFYNHALALFDLDRRGEALEKIGRAIELSPEAAEYHNLKGSILTKNSSFDEAENEFRKALAINPKYGPALFNSGYLFAHTYNPRKSIGFYNKAVAVGYDLKATLVNLALEKLKLNQKASACSDLRRAKKLGRTDISPLIERVCF